MKKNLGYYFGIMYSINTLFVFVFSLLNGQLENINFIKFLPSSIFYVLPYTVIDFLLVGVAVSYLLKNMRIPFVIIPLIFLTILDVVVFIQFFNNSKMSMILIRVLLLLTSYLMYFWITKPTKVY